MINQYQDQKNGKEFNKDRFTGFLKIYAAIAPLMMDWYGNALGLKCEERQFPQSFLPFLILVFIIKNMHP